MNKKYQEEYKSKLRTIDEFLSEVKSGDVFATGIVPQNPKLLLENIHRVNEDVRDIKIYTILNSNKLDFQNNPKYEGRFLNNCFFYGPPDRAAADSGSKNVTYIPNNSNTAVIDMKQAGEKLTYYCGAASPMDEHGFFSLSCSAFIEKDLIDIAEKVVLEVNPNYPRTFGDTEVHISQVDRIIEADYPMPEETLVQPGRIDEQIGAYVADMIEDGSTIQMGIGGVPYAVCKFLDGKQDLGVHTEMFTEGMLELYEKGIINNSKKTMYPGKFVAAFAFGTKKLYEFVKDNPSVMIMRGTITNDPVIISQQHKMVSINAALMIDITGQVCSEAIGTRHYSGCGGQLNTHRGATDNGRKGGGGKGIITIHSMAKGRSKIVPVLPLGSPVTIPRHDLDYVVTEYGVAHMRGRSIRERVLAMINIAHPDVRDELLFEAKKMNYI
ncbi:MAG: acetyl-CoA hydrolase/transferase C-terminal domain-containing protein [Peptococcia bacterium]